MNLYKNTVTNGTPVTLGSGQSLVEDGLIFLMHKGPLVIEMKVGADDEWMSVYSEASSTGKQLQVLGDAIRISCPVVGGSTKVKFSKPS